MQRQDYPRRVLPYLGLLSVLSTAICGVGSPILSDEVFSLELAGLAWGPMLDQLRGDVHPPLYYWLLSVWLQVAPATAAGLRSFSGLCLMAATLLFWRFLRRTGEPETAEAALALWLANPLVILMAGYGRMYLLLAVWCVVALDAGWRICAGEPGRRARMVLAAAVLAGLLTHNWYVFYLSGLAAMLAWRHGCGVWRLAAPLAGGGTLYGLLWGATVWRQVTGSQGHLAWLQRPGWQAPLEAAIAHLWLAALAAPLILVLIAMRPRRGGGGAGWTGAALAGCGVTLAIPLAVSLWKPVFNPRFTIVAAPFLALALAGLVRRGGSAAASLLLLLGAGWGIWDARHPPPCNSRAAAAVLSDQARSGDTVIYTRLTRKPVEWYWRGGEGRRFSFPAEIDRHPGYEGERSEASLREEARLMVSELEGRVFVLADASRLASRILLEELRGAGRAQPPYLACEQAGKHYFSELVQFDLRR